MPSIGEWLEFLGAATLAACAWFAGSLISVHVAIITTLAVIATSLIYFAQVYADVGFQRPTRRQPPAPAAPAANQVAWECAVCGRGPEANHSGCAAAIKRSERVAS